MVLLIKIFIGGHSGLHQWSAGAADKFRNAEL